MHSHGHSPSRGTHRFPRPIKPKARRKLSWKPCVVRGLYEFSATEPGELGFLKGDILEVSDITFETWWRATLRMASGIIPANYVELIDLGGVAKQFDSSDQDDSLEGKNEPKHLISAPKPEITLTSPSNLADSEESAIIQHIWPIDTYPVAASRVIVRCSWSPHGPGKLELQAGNILTALKRSFIHRWKGRLERTAAVGMFPASFVDSLGDGASFNSSLPQASIRSLKQRRTLENDEAVVALRYYTAKLASLLKQFDNSQNDPANNVKIQVCAGI